MIRVLYAFHSGGNFKYMDKVMRSLGVEFAVTLVKAIPFLELPSLEPFDVLIYETFPDEFLPKKFNPELVKRMDERFLTFKGLKILLDAHDWPQVDAFTRFGGAYPRIKHMAYKGYREKFDVVMTFPHCVIKVFRGIPEDMPRPIRVHCAFNTGGYPHRWRETILEMLHRDYEGVTSFDRVPLRQYERFLLSVQISVSADGTGASAACVQTLHAGALLFVHYNAVRDVQILPFADLVDGEDIVEFDFDNFHEKLDWLLGSPADVDRIRKSGQRKFFQGYNVGRSAKVLSDYIHKAVGR